MRSKLIFLIIGCLMMAAASNINICRADAVDDADSVISGIVMYKTRESGCSDAGEWVRTSLPKGAGIDADAYAYGLAKLGGYDLEPYTEALAAFLENNEVRSATTRLKYALCLITNDPDNRYIRDRAEDSVGQLGIMSLVYGLHLANNGYVSADYPAEKIIADIDSMRHEDGGWSVMGQYSDVDVTAMVLQSLAGYWYKAGNGPLQGGTDEPGIADSPDIGPDNVLNSVHTDILSGLDFLAGKQLEDGGYSGFGAANAESTAQVLIALSDLGIDPLSDERFVKNGNDLFDGLNKYRLSEGTYSHIEGGEADPGATSQVFTAMVAYKGMKEGRAPYYVYDGEKTDGATGSGDGKSDENMSGGMLEGNEERGDTNSQDTGDMNSGNTGDKDPDNPGDTYSENAGNPDLDDTGDKYEQDNGNGQEEMSGRQNEQTVPAALSESNRRFRIIACGIIAFISLAACAILVLLKKTNCKNFIFIIILSLIALFAIFRINIRSAEEYYSTGTPAEAQTAGEVTITIRCDTIAGLSDSEFVPQNGIILDKTSMDLFEGESVYDLLVRAVRANGIHMENMKTGLGAHGAYYISGINHIYEYEYGELSGWMYYVNGEAPSVGCGEYILKDGDEVAWLYTREIGRDIVQ